MMPSLVCFLNIHNTLWIPDTHITHKTLFHIFHFLCQHLILVFKVVLPLQVLKVICILLSVILLNNLHNLQFFKHRPFFKDFRRRKIITICKLPVIPQKKSGKVLTSAENCIAIEEKEKRKLEKE